MPPKTRSYSDKLSPIPTSGFMAPPGKKKTSKSTTKKSSTTAKKPVHITAPTARQLESAAKTLMQLSKTVKKNVKKKA